MADLNNVAGKPMAGAIVAALFLQRFLAPGTNWAHLDVYAWNDCDAAGEARRRRGAGHAGGARSHRRPARLIERDPERAGHVIGMESFVIATKPHL